MPASCRRPCHPCRHPCRRHATHAAHATHATAPCLPCHRPCHPCRQPMPPMPPPMPPMPPPMPPMPPAHATLCRSELAGGTDAIRPGGRTTLSCRSDRLCRETVIRPSPLPSASTATSPERTASKRLISGTSTVFFFSDFFSVSWRRRRGRGRKGVRARKPPSRAAGPSVVAARGLHGLHLSRGSRT